MLENSSQKPDDKTIVYLREFESTMDIKTNFPLDTLNTFQLPALASHYLAIEHISDIDNLSNNKQLETIPKLILGGGSNLLFTQNFEGVVIQSKLEGIEAINETDTFVHVRVGSGMEWDAFVEWCVKKNFGGIENLSGIPGTVGAAPIQNIGAYGVEAKDVIVQVDGFDFASKTWKTFTNKDCEFDYRNSIFKRKYKNSFLVSYVTFELSKAPHKLITHYGTIEDELKKSSRKDIGILRTIITGIRNTKLPDVNEYGNAGSFFKNPIVSDKLGTDLQKEYPDLPVYPSTTGFKKLSAAWLIDKAGLKGFTMGSAATHIKQPLVLINKGGATGKEIWQLAQHIQHEVKRKFGIELEPEVNVY